MGKERIEIPPLPEEELKWLKKNIRHKAEIPLTIIAVLITVALIFLMSYLAFFAAENKEIKGFLSVLSGLDNQALEVVLKISGDVGCVAVLYLMIKIVVINSSFLGKLMSNDVRLIDTKYAFVEKEFMEVVSQWNLKKIPQLFVTSSKYSSDVMGTPVRSGEAIVLEKQMLVTAERLNDYAEVEYTLFRRMARIMLGYYSLSHQLGTFGGKIMPGFSELYSRCLKYSEDRLVVILMGYEKTFRSVISECYDLDLYAKMLTKDKISEMMRKESREEKISKVLENMQISIPLSQYRAVALLDFHKPGKLL